VTDVFQLHSLCNSRVLRKASGPTWVDVTGNLKGLHNEFVVLLIKYYSDDQIGKNEMGAACGTYGGEKRRIYILRGHLK